MNPAKRRTFLKQLLLGGVAFGAGYAAHRFLGPDSPESLIKGEEWRAARQLNPTDLIDLRPDAEVLAAAKAQITEHRHTTFPLQMLRPNGEPFSQQEVHLKQIGQGMDWGCSAAGSAVLLAKDPVHQHRSEYFARLFNCTTTKCYWDERWHQPIEQKEGVRIYDRMLDEIAWAQQLGLRVKGHPLVWTVPKAIPDWLHRYPYAKQLDILKQHVQGLVEVAGPAVSRWDVCNEMLWEPAFRTLTRREWPQIDPIPDIADYIAQSLAWAREINPDAIYSLNDYGLVHTYRPELSAADQRARYVALVAALRERDALPDAIGCQAHIGGKFQLDAFQRCLDDLAQPALPLQITEFWVKEKDFETIADAEARQAAMAEYAANIYTLAFAQPLMHHITYWGSRELFTETGEPTRMAQRLNQLIHQEWRTQWSGLTDEQGRITFAGFKGEYEVYLGNQAHPVRTVQLTGGKEVIVSIA
jgi:GH35 family endo-1,4-beta-xylanase